MKTTSLRWLYVFVLITALTWIVFNIWAFNGQWPQQAKDFAFILINLGIVGGLFFPVLVVLLGKKVLPAVDKRIYPDRMDSFRISDNLVFRVLRLNGYAAAINSKRARRLNPLPIDLRTLPDHLRIPIVFYLYWMVLHGVALVIGALALEFLA